MHNQLQTEQLSWLDCVGDLKDDALSLKTLRTQRQDFQLYSENQQKSIFMVEANQYKQKDSEQQTLQIKEQFEEPANKKRHNPFSSFSKNQQFQSSSYQNSSSRQFQKQYYQATNSMEKDQQEGQSSQVKQVKQQLYCKKYRQKKRNMFKYLEEQNAFLKKKVQQLQQRLRQQQRELNRLKYSKPVQEQFTIQDLNERLFQSLRMMNQDLEREQQNNLSSQGQKPKQEVYCQKENKIYKQFFQLWEDFACSGEKRKELLEYHVNEILENMLRDSEKYYFLCTLKNKGWSQRFKKKSQRVQLTIVDRVTIQTFQMQQQNEQQMVQYYKFLRPVLQIFVNSCSEFYKSYKKMFVQLDKVKFFMKASYSANFDIAKRTIKMQNWFQTNKYRKQMRLVRHEWITLIKQQMNQEQRASQAKIEGNKRSKIKKLNKV